MRRALALSILLMPAAGDASEPSINPDELMDLVGAVWSIGPLQAMRDRCLGLFPARAGELRAFYEASSVPGYAKLLEFEPRPQPDVDRDTQLRTLGMSEAQALEWCFKSYPDSLREFDDRYEGREEEVLQLVTRVGQAASAQSAATRTPPAPDPRFAGVFARIVDAANRAYESGDWSTFTPLFVPGTLDCWAGEPPEHMFSSFAVAAIPADATYEVAKFNEIGFGWPYVFPGPAPEHVMEIRYELSRPAGRCGATAKRRWPTLQYFLVQRESDYALTHFCLTPDSGDTRFTPPPSAARTAANLRLLSAKDWETIPREVRENPHFAPSIARLQREHRVSEDEAYALVDHVCDPSNQPP